MFERYSERARRVIFFARYEASQFGSTTIETGHLLLGLIREDKHLVQRFAHNVSAGTVYEDVVKRLAMGPKMSTTALDLPLSTECKRILAYAAEEGDRHNHAHIGTEHLLLGMLRAEGSVAAQVLAEHGFLLETIRESIARGVASHEGAETGQPTAGNAFQPLLSALLHHANLPKGGVIPDAGTATRVAEAVWTALYGAETIAAQQPIRAELKFSIWILAGSASSDPLYAFILQGDGRILSIGRGSFES